MLGNWGVVLFDFIIVTLAQIVCLMVTLPKEKKFVFMIFYVIFVGLIAYIGWPKTSISPKDYVTHLPSISLLLYFLVMSIFAVALYRYSKGHNLKEKFLIPFLLVSFVIIFPYCYQTGLYFGKNIIEPDYVFLTGTGVLLGSYVIGSIKSETLKKIKVHQGGKALWGNAIFFVAFALLTVQYFSKFIPSGLAPIFIVASITMFFGTITIMAIKGVDAVFG